MHLYFLFDETLSFNQLFDSCDETSVLPTIIFTSVLNLELSLLFFDKFIKYNKLIKNRYNNECKILKVKYV